MLIYIATFLISILLTAFAYKQKNRVLFLALSILAILIPCILAGVRHYEIGSDTTGYPLVLFNHAKEATNYSEYLNSTFGDWYALRHVYDIELLYGLISYVITKIFGSFSILLFFNELLIIVPVYLAIYNMKDKVSPWFCMTTFFFMFYNLFINAMRQGIALAFMLYAFSFLLSDKNRKTIKFFIIIVLSCFIHLTGLLGIIVYFLYLIFKNRKTDNYNKPYKNVFDKGISFSDVKIIIVIIASILLMLSVPLVVELLTELNLDYYATYIDGELKFLPRQLIIRVPIIIFFFVYKKDLLSHTKYATFFVCLVVLEAFVAQFVSINSGALRISWVISFFCVISHSALINSVQRGEEKITLKIVMIFYYIMYWAYYFIMCNVGETYPYRVFF